ncbi:MAG: hypothetical protein PHQ34_07975 [Methanothrix sp.]|nr:hypothetical protein [Methanothrix sp.]
MSPAPRSGWLTSQSVSLHARSYEPDWWTLAAATVGLACEQHHALADGNQSRPP